MRILAACLLATISAGPAWAGEKIEFGPAPAWVRPVAMPAIDAKADGNVRYLLLDRQEKLEPGRQSSYAEIAFRIETAEGLSAGNISLPWLPDSQSLTVHRLQIRRGDQMIDVLASGQTFTVLRRESNLESAMLDGMLTANIQPEGLQVGDTIILATTMTSADPVFGRHVELLFSAPSSFPVGRQHFSARWPAAVPVRLQQTPGLPAMKPKRTGDMVEVEATVDGLQPMMMAKGAPDRFRLPRMIELSDFQGWSDLASPFAPLYDKAAALPPDTPLNGEIARIRAGNNDPVKRAEAALMLVQGQVRYVAMLMGSGSLVPADAATTWSRRYGDCKAKTALLLAILRQLGIAAEPVIVDSDGGDGMDERLPMIALFDHVILRATIRGKSYWMDGTRTGDRRLDQLEVPGFGWGLPLVKGAELVRMRPPPLESPSMDSSLRIDARKGIRLPAPVHAELILTGDDAYEGNIGMANLGGDARDRWLRDYWKNRYTFVDVKSATASYDPDRRRQIFVMDGEAQMDWSGGVYWLTDIAIGSRKIDFERDPKEQNREAPVTVAYPYFTRARETILLPPGIIPDMADVEETVGGVEYRRKSSFVDNIFDVQTSVRSVTDEFSWRDAPEAQRTIRAIAARDVRLSISEDYAPSRAEDDQQLAQSPETAAGYVDRGRLLLRRHDWNEAFAAFDRALQLEPGDATALAGRGTSEAWRKHYDAALKDLKAAEAIMPNEPYVLRSLGIVAQAQGRKPDAIDYYTRVINQRPDDGLALGWRSGMLADVGKIEAALLDADKALEMAPNWIELYVLRASIFHKLGRRDKSLEQASAVVAANPGERRALLAAADIYQDGRDRARALQSLNRALAIEADAPSLLQRAMLRPWADLVGRMKDVEAALLAGPELADAHEMKAELLRRKGDLPGAIEALSTAIRLEPNDVILLADRAVAKQLSGRKADADKDFAAARAAATDVADYNALCWTRATAGIDLRAALEDCDTAVAKAPDNSDPIDSRAFVLLRLGRIDEAITGYDRALALQEDDLADSLFGRAVALSRKGETAKAEFDRAAALLIDPDIDEMFRYYGLTM